jgi:hypothetical protein
MQSKFIGLKHPDWPGAMEITEERVGTLGAYGAKPLLASPSALKKQYTIKK